MARDLLLARPRAELRIDLGMGALLLVGSVPLWNYTVGLQPEARTLLYLVLFGFVSCGAGLLIKAGTKLLRGRVREGSTDTLPENPSRTGFAARTLAQIRVDELVALLLIAGFVWLLPRAGFMLASGVAAVGGAALLGQRRWLMWALVTLPFLASAQWLFFDYLNLRSLGFAPW